MKKTIIRISLLSILFIAVTWAQDGPKPREKMLMKTSSINAVNPMGFSHKMGRLWTQILR